MRRTLTAKIVAGVLVTALQLVPASAWADARTASLSGHVLSAESLEPLPGVLVHVGNPKTGAIQSSAPTASDGSFSLSMLPPANYELAVQSDRGLYVVNSSLHLSPGEARRVSVGLRKENAAPSPQERDRARTRGRTNWWNNPLTATAIVVGAAVLIGVLVDQSSSDDNNASPSSP